MTGPRQLPMRIHLYGALMARGWSEYIKSMTKGYFGPMYSPKRQAEIMLNGMALGASRWASNPEGKVRRANSFKKQLEAMAEQDRTLDNVELDAIESLAKAAQRFCQNFWQDLQLDADLKAMIVPLQLSAVRAGAALAFAEIFPSSTTLATFDTLLRESCPADVSWWDLDPGAGDPSE